MIKKVVFILMVLGIVVYSCRKKEERPEVGVDLTTLHCSDGVKNADELGVDCGGVDCPECVQLEAPCDKPEDVLRIVTTFAQNKVIGETELVINEDDKSYAFKAYLEGSTTEYLYFLFPSQPDITKLYKTTSDPGFLNSDEVYMKFNGYSTSDKFASGDLYVTYKDGYYTLISCEMPFHSWGTSTSAYNYDQWFNISFNE